jgi:hypothetical protein
MIGHSGKTWGRSFWESILLKYWYPAARATRGELSGVVN